MPERVVAFVKDLFFATQIEAAAKQSSVPLMTAHSLHEFFEALAKDTPTMAIVDLNCDPQQSVEAIEAVKRSPQPIRVVAFLSHVQVELALAAQQAGADAVVPRSQFSRNLPRILLGKF